MDDSAEHHAPSARVSTPFSQRFSAFTLVMLGIIIFGVLALAPGLKTLIVQRQQIADLEAQVQRQSDEVDELNQNVARWDDPAYVRAQTRQRLYYVVPGEQSFVVIDDLNTVSGHPDVAETTDPSTSITTASYDWRTLLMQSLYTAATSDATLSEDGAGTDESSEPDDGDSGPSDESSDGGGE